MSLRQGVLGSSTCMNTWSSDSLSALLNEMYDVFPWKRPSLHNLLFLRLYVWVLVDNASEARSQPLGRFGFVTHQEAVCTYVPKHTHSA